jgi:hypothetical protein
VKIVNTKKKSTKTMPIAAKARISKRRILEQLKHFELLSPKLRPGAQAPHSSPVLLALH